MDQVPVPQPNSTPFLPNAPSQTDVNFNRAVATNPMYQPKDYLLGRVMLPPWALAKPMRSFVYGDNVTIAAGGSQRLDIALDADSYFLVEQITVTTSEDFTTNNGQLTDIQLSDTTFGQPWSSVPIPLRDLAGFGANTKKLITPNLLRPSSTLSVNLLNRSADQLIYYVCIAGRKIYNIADEEAAFLVRRQWYQYVTTLQTLQASNSGVSTQTITFQTYMDSDFLLKRISSYEMLDQVFTNVTDIICNFRDTTNDIYLFNQQLDVRLIMGSMYTRIDTIAGTGQKLYTYSEAFPLRKPLFIRRNAVVEGSFTNVGTNVLAGPVRIVMEGTRIYSPTPGAQTDILTVPG